VLPLSHTSSSLNSNPKLSQIVIHLAIDVPLQKKTKKPLSISLDAF